MGKEVILAESKKRRESKASSTGHEKANRGKEKWSERQAHQLLYGTKGKKELIPPIPFNRPPPTSFLVLIH